MMKLLSREFTLVAPDLPGHGFSSMPSNNHVSLPSYARVIGGLMDEIHLKPSLVIGHSAGAAIGVRMVLNGLAHPEAIVSFNGAFLPMGGYGDQFFSPLAKMLSLNPLMPRLFAWRASTQGTVARLIQGIGSNLSAEDLAWYQRLMCSPGHVSAALQMMARWELDTLLDEMRTLDIPLLLVAGEKDTAVAMEDTRKVAETVSSARFGLMSDAGHLAHEEQPETAAELIRDAWRQYGGNRADDIRDLQGASLLC
jgi:magnesium chelatase accessory protein